MATTPDVLVDRYEVGRLLGAGGMAEVFEGHDRLLARRVAIKVLLSQFARDPSFLARFKREAQSAASLTHPNIVAVYDTGVQAGTNFIVMEYVEGRTLRDVVRQEGPLLPERAAEITADVAAALAAAHSRGIIHRDIKPANIMITTDGQVKVMDFGIARAVTSESITQTAAVVGTAQYISPEQAQATGVDARSDLYSLGVCLYELLSGRVPFVGNTPVAIAYQHVRDDPPPLRGLNPDVPPSLEAVTLKAMAKNPANRYQTAIEMRDDLLRARSGQGVMATPVLPDAATVAMGRGQAPPEHATSVLGGPMTSTGAGTPYDPYGYEYEGRAARNQQGRGRRVFGWVLVFLAIALLAGAGAYALIQNQNRQEEPKEVTIPTVKGKTAAQAEAQLEALNLEVNQEFRASDDEQGIVVDSDPKAGAKIKEGETVTLFVSSGPGLVEVPDLRGKTLSEARDEVEGNLDVRRGESVFSKDVDKGEIVDQNPGEGTQVRKGSRVTVTISKGPEPTTTSTTTTTTTTTTIPTDTTAPTDTTEGG
jgi:predicted Ser/Thr protein kinase